MADIKAAGAILYKLEKTTPKFLILRSAKHHEWGPPKGHADEGESEIETAVREIFEETGMRKAKFVAGFREALVYEVEKKGRRRTKESVYFLCEMLSDDITLSDEHSEAFMATLDEIEMMVAHEDLKRIF